jgi:hypothetical protein
VNGEGPPCRDVRLVMQRVSAAGGVVRVRPCARGAGGGGAPVSGARVDARERRFRVYKEAPDFRPGPRERETPPRV